MLHFVFFSVMLIINNFLNMPADYWLTDFAALISFLISFSIYIFIFSLIGLYETKPMFLYSLFLAIKLCYIFFYIFLLLKNIFSLSLILNNI